MNALLPLIVAEIKTQGPLTVARYMELALAHEEHGYYRKQDPFGVQGDFITAPEISQMFGEMVGLWCAYMWQAMGRPDPFHLVECGPGRGTLMMDALRAANHSAGFLAAVRVHLVETSRPLRDVQKQALEPSGVDVTWHDTFGTVDSGPVLVIGNEFFDALPVHQFVRGEDGWHERLVGLNGEALAFSSAPDPVDLSLIPETVREKSTVGDVYEDQPVSRTIMCEVAGRIVAHGGAALFIDYGHDQHGLGDTLQALKSHQFVDILVNPGEQDLTTHVDFEQLSKVATQARAEVFSPLPQGVFLEQLGLRARVEALKKGATEAQVFELNRAYSRLTSPEQMGTLFRVMGLAAPGLNVVPWS